MLVWVIIPWALPLLPEGRAAPGHRLCSAQNRCAVGSGGLAGVPGILVPSGNRGSRKGAQVVPEGGGRAGFWGVVYSLGKAERTRQGL